MQTSHSLEGSAIRIRIVQRGNCDIEQRSIGLRGTNKEDCEEKREREREREEAVSAIELKFTNGRRNPDMKS